MFLWMAIATLYFVLLTIVLMFMAGASQLNEKADRLTEIICRDLSGSERDRAA